MGIKPPLRILNDSREFAGQMLAFDKYMNLVLGDCEEFRRVKSKDKKEDQLLKRTLGLVILRGEWVVSISVDGPPPPSAKDAKARLATMAAGPGVARPMGRGLPVAPPSAAFAPGLSGPARGVGAPAPGMMQPRGPVAAAAPMNYGRPPAQGGHPGMPMPPPGFRPGPPPGFAPPGGPAGRGGPPPGFNQPPPGFRPPPGRQ
ncbi:hypothetical protein CONCODRAFT_57951 [Conidiobolus coronatus NRRL 28638]|uniref:Sm protein B n=1 Tax=Conidiobolus coronatus (strain ATCC 28846 / CBS 209.66 / NRRL 28638) TaxID=796925 RepID=A0A137P7B7_CONC2|nr:hypothetical protein CONCODRAFT_57951 [Conidiobolus coronatus NRRL 28638]|eukprot:KXN70898.1 hypothetical protein CONCODRAFT_57951 [Conidiobolus coronatus NRRL 28638]